MSPFHPRIFLSYAGADAFEANLFQFALENLLSDLEIVVWSYLRDQAGNERSIAGSLKLQIKESCAVIFLLSPHTLAGSGTQWMELAYADAFNIPTFVLLHHLTFDSLKQHEPGIPPLLLAGQCTPAVNWRRLESELRRCCQARPV